MVAFEDAKGTDPTDVHQKLYQLKTRYEFNKSDLKFWFNQFESCLQDCGVKNQWTKRRQLANQLPQDAINEVKQLLELTEDEAGDLPYKDLKNQLFELYAPKHEELFQKAMDALMTSTPSALLKKLTDLICQKRPCLENCCCAGLVSGMWRAKLPAEVRKAVSNIKLSKETMKMLGETADAFYRATLIPAGRIAAAAVAAVVPTKKVPMPVTSPKIEPPKLPAKIPPDWPPNLVMAVQNATPQPITLDSLASQMNQLAAVVKKGYQGNKNKGQNQNQSQQRNSGNGRRSLTKHRDDPPPGVCNQHYSFGKTAWYCQMPDDCPWRMHLQKRPKKSNS